MTGEHVGVDPSVLESFGPMVDDMFPICVVANDEAGTLVYANAKLHAFLGYPDGELVGQPLDTIIPHASRVAHHHYRRGFMARPSMRPMGRDREVVILKRDQTTCRVMIALGPENIEGVPKLDGSVASVILPVDGL